MNISQMWVIIGFGILAAIVLLIVLCKRGGSIGTKQLSIYIPETKKGDSPLGKSLQYLYDALPLIRAEFEGAYFHLAKLAGIKDSDLMTNEDVRYFIQMTGNFVYSGNGINSIKTILEQTISSRAWPEDKNLYDDFCAIIIRRISQTVTKYNNSNYDDFVKRADGNLRDRTVCSVAIFKEFANLYRVYDKQHNQVDGAVAVIIIDIIDHAKALMPEGKK